MANYYTHFSFLMIMPSEEAKKHALDIHRRAASITEEGNDDAELRAIFNEETLENWQMFVEDGDTKEKFGLWIYDGDGEGNTNTVAEFVFYLMRKFDMQEFVAFQFANTASRPILDAYGGGALFITQNGVEHMTSGEWLNKKEDAWNKKKSKK